MRTRGGDFLARLMLVVLCTVAGCGRNRQTPATNAVAATQSVTTPSQNLRPSGNDDYRAIFAAADKATEEKLSNVQTNDVPLPNVDLGPGLPLPLGVNFYERDKRYPGYLLCTYHISESRYDRDREKEWLRAALAQIRQQGRQRFPPIMWIAVAVFNRGDYRGPSTFERCYRAGAIFAVKEVFDGEHDLQQMVARTQVDRYPLVGDSQGNLSRWTMVERHITTNHAATGSKNR